MAHFPEGYEVQGWPEFLVLAHRLGIRTDKLGARSKIVLRLDDPDAQVLVEHTYPLDDGGLAAKVLPVVEGAKETFCIEVYQWPEFQTFCERLGIAYEAYTVAIRIIIPGDGELVSVKHTYRGVDNGPILPQPNPPQFTEKVVSPGGAITNTTLHNTRCRTKQPRRLAADATGEPIILERPCDG